MIVLVYLSFVSIHTIDANFFRDLMKDKLGALGVSGRDPADDDDEYTIQ